MGRLIDVDEVKKRYPIMRNDFGMVINESLHKDLDKIPTVEAISKVDMVAIFDKIRTEIEGYKSTADNAISEDELKIEGMKEAYTDCLGIIDKYRTENEVTADEQ
jgi:hypothetical protein